MQQQAKVNGNTRLLLVICNRVNCLPCGRVIEVLIYLQYELELACLHEHFIYN